MKTQRYVILLGGIACSLALSLYSIWHLHYIMQGVFTLITCLLLAVLAYEWTHRAHFAWLRFKYKQKKGKYPLGLPPKRNFVNNALSTARKKGCRTIDRYLLGFEVNTGEPISISDDEMCTHAAVFAQTGVGKTLWLESILFQHMARGGMSGATFIDAKRDSETLSHVVLMAILTGRLEDLIVIDPFEPLHRYNFCQTDQAPEIKARKILRTGLPHISDHNVTKHYDRLAGDAICRIVRALESLDSGWSIRDVAMILSSFNIAYPLLSKVLINHSANESLIELGHLVNTYRKGKNSLDYGKMTENLRGIAAELNSFSHGNFSKTFCSSYTDLSLTSAILQGKIIYFMVPRLEESEIANRIVKLIREDIEISIGEITSNPKYRLESPHLIIVDEGASTFGPTWANLFELARKGRFGLLFGAQSAGALTDQSMGLSQAFYERVMANVNTKVTMKLGDNRTARDMSEWMGDFCEYPIDRGKENQQNKPQGVNIASKDVLKRHMSSEKGLAWFDIGGRTVQGKALWFDAKIPESWNGRSKVIRFREEHIPPVGIAEAIEQDIFIDELDRMKQENKGRAKMGNSEIEKEDPSGNNCTKEAVRTNKKRDSRNRKWKIML